MRTEKTRITGFTLVELIVVIAIIAILATVSIVGFQSYISRARVSNDVTDARNMTGVLQNYMTLNGLDNVDAAEIRSIVNIENDYSFEPRVEGYSFWYNESTRTIELKTSYEVMFEEDDFTELTGTSMTRLLNDEALDAPAVGDKLEEVVQGFYLLDTGGSDFADALYGLRNLKTLEDYNRIVGAGDYTGSGELETYAGVKGHITANFNLDDTLYINDFFGFTASGNTDVLRVVFADGIESVPGSALSSVTTLPEEIKLPISIKVIESGAFAALTTTKLIYDDVSRIQVEEGAMNPADTNNSALVTKEGSVNLEELTFTVDYATETTRLYAVSFVGETRSETYEGKRVKISDDPEAYDYYSKEGVLLESGVEYDALVPLFSDSSYLKVTTRETDIRLNLEPEINGTPTGSLVHGVHVTYREYHSFIIAEAKAYDANGTLFAKGSIMTLKLISKVEFPETTTLTFDWNDDSGNTYTTITRIEGQGVSAPQAPEREGFTFDGWYTDAATTQGNEYIFSTMPENDQILYAKWT